MIKRTTGLTISVGVETAVGKARFNVIRLSAIVNRRKKNNSTVEGKKKVVQVDICVSV
jgi:hypothetical protein